jgi:hypothetical protein
VLIVAKNVKFHSSRIPVDQCIAGIVGRREENNEEGIDVRDLTD